MCALQLHLFRQRTNTRRGERDAGLKESPQFPLTPLSVAGHFVLPKTDQIGSNVSADHGLTTISIICLFLCISDFVFIFVILHFKLKGFFLNLRDFCHKKLQKNKTTIIKKIVSLLQDRCDSAVHTFYKTTTKA